MSRPRWSVPSQYRAPGRASVWALVAMGSWVAITSAPAAVSTIASITPPPRAPSGFRRANRARRRQAGRRSGTEPDPWIEDRVEPVHDQVGDDHHRGDEHDQVLHDR